MTSLTASLLHRNGILDRSLCTESEFDWLRWFARSAEREEREILDIRASARSDCKPRREQNERKTYRKVYEMIGQVM